MAARTDLIIEVDATTDGSGNYAGDWFDSGSVLVVRAVVSGIGNCFIEESADQVHLLTYNPVSGAPSDIPITGRYFRFAAVGSTPNAALRAAVRRVA
jgi:hypothetical protein